MNKSIVTIILTSLLAMVEPHGYVKSPLSRTSIFRESKWNTQMPYWWDDTGVWCGNIEQNLHYSQCGRCGDAAGGSTANQGGIYDKGVITGTYTAGQVYNMPLHRLLKVTLRIFIATDNNNTSRNNCWS